jgi:hypothetical protein
MAAPNLTFSNRHLRIVSTSLFPMDHLPVEIILDVLSISSPDTIATFLCTASKYRDAAEPLLYNSITLRGPEALQGLLERLEAKPQFASRVRHLVARWGGSFPASLDTHDALTPLLARTENLESLVLRGFHEGIHVPSPLVRLLDIECDCFPRSPRAVCFLSQIPNLRSIVLKEGAWSWMNIWPDRASLATIWGGVLRTVTVYSGPSYILSLLPKGSSLKHIQTPGLDSLDGMREATEGAIVSLECTPLPLHPPRIGFYFPNIQFLGMFQLMTIPPQPVWVRELTLRHVEYCTETLVFRFVGSRIQSAYTISKRHARRTPPSCPSWQSSDNCGMSGSGLPTHSRLIQSCMIAL